MMKGKRNRDTQEQQIQRKKQKKNNFCDVCNIEIAETYMVDHLSTPQHKERALKLTKHDENINSLVLVYDTQNSRNILFSKPYSALTHTEIIQQINNILCENNDSSVQRSTNIFDFIFSELSRNDSKLNFLDCSLWKIILQLLQHPSLHKIQFLSFVPEDILSLYVRVIEALIVDADDANTKSETLGVMCTVFKLLFLTKRGTYSLDVNNLSVFIEKNFNMYRKIVKEYIANNIGESLINHYEKYLCLVLELQLSLINRSAEDVTRFVIENLLKTLLNLAYIVETMRR